MAPRKPQARSSVRDYRGARGQGGGPENAPATTPGPLEPVSFVVPGKPVSTNQTYRVGRARMFKSLVAQRWQDEVRVQSVLAIAGRPAFACPVEVRITFWFDSERPDTDGPVKGLLDRLAPHVYRNDRQVARYSVTRRIDREHPRTEVWVAPWAVVERVLDAEAVRALFVDEME